MLVVDEDYTSFGLSGELAAVAAEAGLTFKYARVGTIQTIPFNHSRELDVLPNTGRITDAAMKLVGAR